MILIFLINSMFKINNNIWMRRKNKKKQNKIVLTQQGKIQSKILLINIYVINLIFIKLKEKISTPIDTNNSDIVEDNDDGFDDEEFN